MCTEIYLPHALLSFLTQFSMLYYVYTINNNVMNNWKKVLLIAHNNHQHATNLYNITLC